jgi:glucose-1-phosphate cytidylyltransferase
LKTVILAGGIGSRISEESHLKPKPMIEIGGRPILWHIMKHYSYYGLNDFIICCGYKGYVIKEYFSNYSLHMSDITFDIQRNQMETHKQTGEPWRVTLVDTGDKSNTGGRIKGVQSYLTPGESFCLTYGDGLSDIDISQEIAFHKNHGKLATVCAVQPPGRFGALKRSGSSVVDFEEKPLGDSAWINGGFFVLQPEIIQYIEGDLTAWESSPMAEIARDGQMEAWEHRGFWQPMDTLRDKNFLEDLWSSGNPPWQKKNS